MEFGVEAPCSASCERGAVSGEPSISCHLSELQGGAGVVESTAVSGLSKRPASASVPSARRLTSSTSASEALESPSASRTIGSSIPRQKKLVVYFHNRRCSARAYLDSRLSYRFALPCSGRQSRPSPLKLTPQLRPSCLGLDPPLQNPALVAWRAVVLRLWGGRGRRRFRHHLSCRCVRKQCRSLVRFPHVSHYRYKPNTSPSHTANSGPVAPIIIGCCRRCWSQRAKWCTARLDLLELVEDIGLFRGRLVAGCCALGARSSWHVNVRFEGKSGHLERVEMIGSSREVLRRLLAV